MPRCYNYVDCFEEADPGSLWGPKCRAANALIHQERAGAKAARIQAETARVNAEDQARTMVECEGRCGRWVPNARRQQAGEVERLRRQVQAKLMLGQIQVDGGQPLDSFAAYCRAIELTAPHRLQQARNLCDPCLVRRMEDSRIFLGDSPTAPAAAPIQEENVGEQEQAIRPDQ